MALIELDLDAPPDRLAGRGAPPPWRYRHLGLAVAVLLLLAAAGASPAGGTFWRPLGLIPAPAGAESTIQIAGGRVFTIVLAGQSRTLTAWDPQPSPHRLWSAEVPISATFDPAKGVFGPIRVQRIGGLLLVGAGLSSTILDPDTGAIRWTTPNRITPVPGGLAVLTDRIFRPGTLYDQESGDPGMLYFSADGQPHVEPPVRTEVRGLDLATGEVLWTATPGGSVTAEAAPGDGPPAVLITASDRLSLRDARTGAVLRETGLPEEAGAGPGTSDVLDDVALIGYPEAGLQVGYDVRTLDRLWTRDLHTEGEPDNCAGLLCTGGDREVSVLDRRTGRALWSAPATAELASRTGSVLMSGPDPDGPERLVDARTGAPRADLSGWTGEVEGFDTHALLLWRAEKDGGRAFGAVLPGATEVRYLGTADGLGGDCGGDDRYVVCRDVRGLRVWAYRI
ncbi:PQQ-binding-like beta-propeller repeat protein [Actinoplanes sp. NPDC026670]|uniref:outer membrane protein assembly factor BamB family protein n=1 Tax=Actinoplanes sp. NPDC026670 TaxID=3154700 RepID=UPI0033D11741